MPCLRVHVCVCMCMRVCVHTHTHTCKENILLTKAQAAVMKKTLIWVQFTFNGN
jgi:hypothetical protein